MKLFCGQTSQRGMGGSAVWQHGLENSPEVRMVGV